MKRSIGTTAATLAALFVLTAAAVGQQTFVNEDFSTGVGNTPPAGWSSSDAANGTSAPSPLWRFDNPSGRGITAPLSAPVAICDSDDTGSGAVDANLETPVFDTSTAAQVLLEWDQHHQPLGSLITVTVRDGLGGSTVVYSDGAGTPVNDSQSLDITAACGGSATCSVVFNYNGNFDWWWMVDNVDIFEPAMDDVGVTAISVGSGDCLLLGSADAISIDVQNFGTATLAMGTMIPVEYNVDAGPAVMETFTLGAALAPGGTDSYTFSTTADLSAGTATIDARTQLGTDGNAANDQSTAMFANDNLYTLPFLESFDGVADNSVVMPTDWINDPNDSGGTGQNNDWEGETAGTGSSGTGPNAPNSGAAYVYTEDGGTNAAINLISPCIDLSAGSLPLLKFALHSLNANDAAPNSFSVDLISGGAVTTMDLVGPIGEVSADQNDWVNFTTDISAFNGQVVRFQFRSSTDNGGTAWFAHDIALDDVEVSELVFGSGQAPSAGLSSLDINNAQEQNGFGVGSGANGPYTSVATGGGTITFTMEGEPNEAISLLEGPLNVGVLTVPGVGQVDIGIDDMMGGVMNVAIVADGTLSGGLNPLFIIQPSGSTSMSFTVPLFPAPATFTFQAFIRSTIGNPPGAMSNAVSVGFN